MIINSLYDQRIFEINCDLQAKAYYYREWKQYFMKPHTHNRVEIMYVISGKCYVFVNENAHIMKKGDMVLLDANVEHRLLVNPGVPCRILNVEFVFRKNDGNYTCFTHMLKSNEEVESLFKSNEKNLFIKDPDEICHILKSLIFELDNVNNRNDYTVQLLFSLLFARISRHLNQNFDNETKAEKIYVKKALQFIHDFYDRDLRIRNIAKSVNIHSSYLHRIFKKNTGITIMEYLTKLRIEKAKMLLRQTDISIIDIANYIGINSRQYFTYIFKKNTGKTPREYRKEKINNRNIRISDI